MRPQNETTRQTGAVSGFSGISLAASDALYCPSSLIASSDVDHLPHPQVFYPPCNTATLQHCNTATQRPRRSLCRRSAIANLPSVIASAISDRCPGAAHATGSSLGWCAAHQAIRGQLAADGKVQKSLATRMAASRRAEPANESDPGVQCGRHPSDRTNGTTSPSRCPATPCDRLLLGTAHDSAYDQPATFLCRALRTTPVEQASGSVGGGDFPTTTAEPK